VNAINPASLTTTTATDARSLLGGGRLTSLREKRECLKKQALERSNRETFLMSIFQWEVFGLFSLTVKIQTIESKTTPPAQASNDLKFWTPLTIWKKWSEQLSKSGMIRYLLNGSVSQLPSLMLMWKLDLKLPWTWCLRKTRNGTSCVAKNQLELAKVVKGQFWLMSLLSPGEVKAKRSLTLTSDSVLCRSKGNRLRYS
jgi:hypothetical protein